MVFLFVRNVMFVVWRVVIVVVVVVAAAKLTMAPTWSKEGPTEPQDGLRWSKLVCRKHATSTHKTHFPCFACQFSSS